MYILSSGLDNGDESFFDLRFRRFNRDEGNDTTVNMCGVTKQHSFPLIKFLNLTSNEDFHLMYLVRDPRGNFSIVDYNQKWNKNDPDWTEELLSQLPYPVENSNGYFYVGDTDLFSCF